MNHATRQYLDRHAEPEAGRALDLMQHSPPKTHAICIPACNEDAGFLQTLDTVCGLHTARDTLLVLVVNGAEDSPDTVHEGNQRFLALLRSHLDFAPGTMVICRKNSLDLLLVDRASPGHRLPEKQGVGLARKIACDIAVALHAHGRVRSPWILSTDADVALAPDTLDALPADDAPGSAALYPFVHSLEGDPEQQRAMVQYETFLHYHVLGLRFARSPYANHAIGSLIAVNAQSYAAVRGFPRRRAGEDFYLLNKLRKVAPLLDLPGPRIQIRGRVSHRVPFGTGAAVKRLSAQPAEAYRVYPPTLYEGLRRWQAALAAFSAEPDPRLLVELGEDALGEDLAHALDTLGALDAARDASQRARPGHALAKRLLDWNDAFRSLKLLHALRDRAHPAIPLDVALRTASFLPALQGDDPREHLVQLRTQVESHSPDSTD
jgi:hypothetical protein